MVDLVGEFVRAASAKPLAKLAPLVREIMKEYVSARPAPFLDYIYVGHHRFMCDI
jgi:hypothetical protein